KMVINVPHMSHIRPEFRDHRPNPASCLAGINRPRRQLNLVKPSALLLEIDVRHKIPVVRSRTPSRIGHRKQRHLMPLGTHKFHRFEQVDLGAAEGMVIFVAIQDPHEECITAISGRGSGWWRRGYWGWVSA